MNIIVQEPFNNLVKTDTIDTNLFLLNILKNIYNIIENTPNLNTSDKLDEISHIFKSICFPTIETTLKPTLFSQMFKNITPIANGGFGVVYKAQHYLDNEYYAIKRMPMYIDFGDKSHISSLLLEKLREIRCLAKLNHPNIIIYKTSWLEPDSNLYQSEYDDELALLDDSETSSNSDNDVSLFKKYIKFNVFYQMELMDISLRDVLNMDRLKTRDNLIFVFNKILEGLDYLHTLETPIIHMDIKPENILLKIKKGTDKIIDVKLADFGLLKYVYETNSQEGTTLYISPERENKICDPSADIYSLGIILYETAHKWDTEMERIIKITELKENPSNISGFTTVKTMVSDDYMKRPRAKELLDVIKISNIINIL
uniref:Protein kinase domain-containing protein n=1 Tax=viral metagenome TaxID=1070528 RepID=A0A6C0EIR1_9ZZZZ